MSSIAAIMSTVVPGTFVPDLGVSEAPAVSPIPPLANAPADFDHLIGGPALAEVGALGDGAAASSGAGAAQTSGGVPSVRGDTTFKDTVKSLLADVNDSLNKSDQNTRDLADGKTNDVNKVITSVEEANLALQYTMAIRTKLLEAYTSVQTMTV
jgi:flagellar hook-basal body complex protein FliE